MDGGGGQVNSNWERKTLAEACEINPPKSEARDRVPSDELVSFLPMEDLGIDNKYTVAKKSRALSTVIGSYTYFANNDVLLAKITPCFENGKAGIAKDLINGVGFGSSEYIVFRPNNSLNKEWLYYFLTREPFRIEGQARMSGAVGHKRVSKEFIETSTIPVPPFPEQVRLVRILDEAFEAIATAKANAEKNLQNVRALFESHLQAVFSQQGEGWEEKALGEIAEFKNGLNFNRSSKGQALPIVGVSDFQDSYYVPFSDLQSVTIDGDLPDSYAIQKNDILLVRSNGSKHLVGRCLLVGEMEGVVSYSGFVIRVRFDSKKIFPKYLLRFLKCQATRTILTSGGGGANITNINQEKLSTLLVAIPPYSIQVEISSKLDAVHEEIQQLESTYQRKLATLEALKKSLLHQAFSGQLTTFLPQTIIPFPTKVPDIAPKDLHAGILAIAYQFHESKGNLENYGHVKAEKIAHMVEVHLGIDLERTPIKDAAGPNDYPHSRKVEHRARMAGFFDFHRNETGAYQVKKLPGFDKLILRTREKLGDRVQGVIDLMNLMVGMNTRQAEIFATVHAAWNNLLLDDKPAADEDIVTEARENWHPAKMDIPREKFFKAIGWIRERKLMPKGMGKRVTAKA